MSEDQDLDKAPPPSDDEDSIVYLDIKVTRRFTGMPDMATAIWLKLKSLMFTITALLSLYILLVPETMPEMPARLFAALGLVWLIWDMVICRRHYGVSHILLTDKGVLFTAENIYLRWENIDSYLVMKNLMRLKPKAGFGPQGLFGTSDLDLPLNLARRDFAVDLIRQRVTRWQPSKD